MNKALLDTDTYSEVLKAVNPTVARNAASYRLQHGVYSVSVISVFEIVYGFQRVQNHRRLQEFLAAVAQEEVIPLEHPAAELAGRIAGDLDRTGQTIGKADPMIAAVALHRGLELVTGNTVPLPAYPEARLSADPDQLAITPGFLQVRLALASIGQARAIPKRAARMRDRKSSAVRHEDAVAKRRRDDVPAAPRTEDSTSRRQPRRMRLTRIISADGPVAERTRGRGPGQAE